MIRLAAAALLLGASCAACSSSEPENSPPPLDIASLPTLGDTQQDMLDLVVAAQAEVRNISPDTAPWKWLSAYTITDCVGGRVDGGSAMFLPDLVSSGPLSTEQWTEVYAAVVEVAGDAGLTETEHQGDMNVVELSSNDGRTLRLSSAENVVLTATISCRRGGGVTFGLDNAVLMPPDPQ